MSKDRATITTTEWKNYLEHLKFKVDCHARALQRDDNAFAIKLYYEIMAELDAVELLGIITETERDAIEAQLYKYL